MKWFKLYGKLVYDAPRGNNFKKTHKVRTLTIELVCEDLDLYYAQLIADAHGPWVNLNRPMFGTHVTVIKGNEPIHNEAMWGKRIGQSVEIEFAPESLRRTTGYTMKVKGQPNKPFGFWTVDVRGESLKELRQELGCKLHNNFHITVAREHTEFRVKVPTTDKLPGLIADILAAIPKVGGNQLLERELKIFNSLLPHHNGRELLDLLHRNIPTPGEAKGSAWELNIINLLK